MHHHCEIVIPPTDDIPNAIASVMKKFDENGEDEDGGGKYAFWDFYVIGGRFAGHKTIAKYDQAKLDQFYAWMREEKITVCGFTAGKQEIAPSYLIPKVDAKWNEMFPSSTLVLCPLFKHSNDQYAKAGPLSGTLPDDVCRLIDVPEKMQSDHVIFAGPSLLKVGDEYEHVGPLEAVWMVKKSMYNGVNYVDTTWDKTLPGALAYFRKGIEMYSPEYAEKINPKDDWMVVTVDYS